MYYWMKFPKCPKPGKLLSICTSLDFSVNPSGSLSVTPSLSAENLLKFPSNHGDENAVNYLHEIMVNIPAVHTSSVTPVIAAVHASSFLFVHLSDNKHQEIPDELPGTSCVRKPI